MRKTGLLIGLAILILLLLSFFLWQLKSNSPLNRELTQKSQELKEAKAASRRLEGLEKQNQELKQKAETMYKRVPLEEKQPFSLIKTLLGVGKEAGLREIAFTVKEETPKIQTSGTTRPASQEISGRQGVPARKRESLEEIPMEETRPQQVPSTIPTPPQPSQAGVKSLHLEMNFMGTFSQLLNFLNRLNDTERIVSVEGIKIERQENILPYQKISLDLVTYIF